MENTFYLEKNSFITEVNSDFVSNPYPRINEQISIKLAIKSSFKNVKNVILRNIRNGSSNLHNMKKIYSKNDLDYYEVYVILNEYYFHYHFIIITDSKVYYLTKKDLTLYPPTEDNDFVIIANFDNPDWVSRSVFYQIFPDRFKNQDKESDVKDGEWSYDGGVTKHLEWNEKPLDYHVGRCLDFYGGDLKGIEESIEYFKELGINALYLNPIFSARTNHRYDCIDYFNVDPHLGGNEALISLVNKLHENGIKIIIDVSINHTGCEHYWYKKAIDDSNSIERGFYYFEAGKQRFWAGVQTLPQLNYKSELLRDLIYRGNESFIRKYLRPPFNIDGYRFDVGNDTGRNNEDQLSNSLWKEIRDVIKHENKNSYILSEHWEDNISYLQGDQWDGSMNYFSSARPLRSFMGENDRFLFHLLGISSGYYTSGGKELAERINIHNSRIPNQLLFLQFNLIDSHDIFRIHHSTCFDKDIYKGLLLIAYMLPGTFSIYYGDEICLNGSVDSIESARYSMEWDRNKWDLDLFNYYKELNKIKINYSQLHNGAMQVIYYDYDVFVIARFNSSGILLGIINRGCEKEINYNIQLGEERDSEFVDLFSGQKVLLNNHNFSMKVDNKKSYIFYHNN